MSAYSWNQIGDDNCYINDETGEIVAQIESDMVQAEWEDRPKDAATAAGIPRQYRIAINTTDEYGTRYGGRYRKLADAMTTVQKHFDGTHRLGKIRRVDWAVELIKAVEKNLPLLCDTAVKLRGQALTEAEIEELLSLINLADSETIQAAFGIWAEAKRAERTAC